MISATVVGNLGRDAELRSAGNTPVVSFNVASSEKSKDGETTTWTRVSFFGSRAEKIIPYLTKGKTVAVRGSLSLREYQGKDGTTKTSLELRADDVKLLGVGNREQTANGARGVAQAAHDSVDLSYDPNADIPF